ncbi:hypothetical protein ABIB62_001715 [Mucilaginibacter sp. UYP25]|uniref:hypothetical protein n=1 Tax=unclassified Mucilaginibacter TaxID=2617802 RepID=UPI0033952724
MKNQLYTLIKKFVLLLLILFVLDYVFGTLIERAFYKEKQGDSSTTTYALSKANENLLIFGTSRASHHYISSVIGDSLQVSAYNLGRDGIKFDYNYALITSVLKRYSPKYIILDINQNDFTYDTLGTQKEIFTSTFLPYTRRNSYIKQLIYQINPREIYKSEVSKLYAFNSLPGSILQHALGVGQKNDHGYEALFGSKLTATDKTIVGNSTNYKEDTTLVRKFDEMIATIEKRKIKLLVVVSPTLNKFKNNPLPTVNKTLSKYGLKTIDFSDAFAAEDNSKLFHDRTHLNNNGSKLYTQLIIQAIKK